MHTESVDNARAGRKAAQTTEGTKRKFNGAPLNALKPRNEAEERGKYIFSRLLDVHSTNELAEDFRTALQEAMGYLRSLHKLSGPTPLSPSTSPSTSNITSATNDHELDRLRVDTMNHLIGVLQRNLRVRYDLNIPDVVQA